MIDEKDYEEYNELQNCVDAYLYDISQTFREIKNLYEVWGFLFDADELEKLCVQLKGKQ